MAEVCLDVVDVKTHRSMGGNVYSCVCVCVCVCVRGVVRERERKKGLRGFEGKRAREKAGEERRKEVLIFSG